MKRIFVFAVLAGAFAVPASMAQAQMGDAPAAQPNQAEVQPSERGALGGLASGAPSVAQSVQPGAAAPQAAAPQGAAPQVAPQAVAPQAGVAQGQAPAGQGVVAQTGVAGQAVAGQGVVAQQGVAGQAVAGQGVVAQQGVAGGVVAGGQTVVGMQQSFHSQMQRHFMVQQAFQHCMFFSDFQPHVFRPVAGPIGFGGPFFAPVPGDLELISVGMVADGIADKGPMYRVTFKNHGAIAARHFRVSLIATLGQLQPSSPVISVNIEEVAPGAIANVDIQLPFGVMTLGGTPAGPFSQLIAVIDSFGELFETNKLNNVLTLTRTDITVITTTTVAPAAGVAAPAAAAVAAPAAAGIAPAAAAPAVGGPAAGAPAAGPAGPAAPAAPAPRGNGELDKIDLDQVSGASELLDR